MKKLYFIDYDENEVFPFSGEKSLVEKYEKLMDKADMPITTYPSKVKMLEDAAEWASQAKDGCAKHEYLNEDEMKNKIKEIKEWLSRKFKKGKKK